MRRGVAALLAVLGLWQAAAGLWIPAKAALAQVLLERAWQAGAGARPWPWADTWPVARLHLPGSRPLLVLHGDSGRTLAFGPGLAAGSVAPGAPGTLLIAGHRDTHFRALRELRPGQALTLETRGRRRDYRIDRVWVLDSRREAITEQYRERLLLLTCYPFDAALPGGPLRYVVSALPEEPLAARSGNPGHDLPPRGQYSVDAAAESKIENIP